MLIDNYLRVRHLTVLLILAFLLSSAGLLELGGVPAGAIKIFSLLVSLVLAFLICVKRGLQLSVYPSTLAIYALICGPVIYHCYISGFSATLLAALLQVFAPLIFYFSIRYFTDGHNVDAYSREATFAKSRLIKLFLSAQIIAALFKLLVVGQEEGRGIGTVSVQAGSLSTFIVVLTCTAAFWCKKFLAGLAVLTAALFFAWVNEKRLGVLLAALSFGVYTYFIAERFSQPGVRACITVIALPVLLSIFYFAVQTIDSILHGYSVWQLPIRIFEYLNQSDSAGNPIGRLAGLTYSIGNVSNYQSLFFGTQPLFAFGSSALGVETNYNDVGFRPSAFVVTFVRFGFFGVLAWIIFFWHVISKISREPKFYLFSFFLVADFLIYSDNAFVSYLFVLSIYFATSFSHPVKRIAVP